MFCGQKFILPTCKEGVKELASDLLRRHGQRVEVDGAAAPRRLDESVEPLELAQVLLRLLHVPRLLRLEGRLLEQRLPLRQHLDVLLSLVARRNFVIYCYGASRYEVRKFFGFFSLSPLSTFGSDLYFKIQANSLDKSASDADIISGSSLR